MSELLLMQNRGGDNSIAARVIMRRVREQWSHRIIRSYREKFPSFADSSGKQIHYPSFIVIEDADLDKE